MKFWLKHGPLNRAIKIKLEQQVCDIRGRPADIINKKLQLEGLDHSGLLTINNEKNLPKIN